jgi:HK97 family phage major capsid protein
MKKLNDLKTERYSLVTRMSDIVKRDNISESDRIEWENLDTQVRLLNVDIDNLEKQDMINKMTVLNGTDNNRNVNTTTTSFRNWIGDAVSGATKESYKIEVRDWLTTNDSNILNKTVQNVDIIYSPAEKLLRDMGVRFMTGVGSQVVFPSMSEDNATFVGEDSIALDASMVTTSNTLTPIRCSHTQAITKETLAQTNILNDIKQNLYNGIWNAVAEKFFNEVDTDAATQLCTKGNETLSFNHIVNLEASVAYDLVKPAYVMKPQTKSFLKKTPKFSSAINAIWENDKVNEYPAFSSPFCNQEHIYYGDWSKTVLAVYGNGIEIIVDPFTKANYGEVVLTAIGLFDCGVINKRAFSILSDASTY